MILGFLGKGGSGKSTVATQMALFLARGGRRVLAIDADHNMDLSHNLGSGRLPKLQYLGSGLADVLDAVGLAPHGKYQQAFDRGDVSPFRLSPLDSFSAAYSCEVSDTLRLMAAGPQTDQVLYGQSCSHILTTALKVYLPLLELAHNEVVLVDEKAGADGVTTGVVTGLDVGAIVVEPALHSLKTARQIGELMDFYGTPYVFVGNKVATADDAAFLREGLGIEPIAILPRTTRLQRAPYELYEAWEAPLHDIAAAAQNLSRDDRYERTKAKFKRNAEFADEHAH